jgi:serine/threonine-protein kinase
VWFSEPITKEVKEVLAVQEEIAGLIAKNLSLKLGVAAERATANPEAFSLLLQGRHFARQESNAGRQQSIELYRRAIGLKPGFALAWAELAQSYSKLARFGGLSTADGMRQARLAAEKALGLDPYQVVALDALGSVQRTADWDRRAAQKTFQRALALAPGNAAILADAAILYFNVGRVD